jgi:hypothetical protein
MKQQRTNIAFLNWSSDDDDDDSFYVNSADEFRPLPQQSWRVKVKSFWNAWVQLLVEPPSRADSSSNSFIKNTVSKLNINGISCKFIQGNQRSTS